MSDPSIAAPAAKNRMILHMIKLAVFFGLMFGIGFLPPFGSITALGMKILGIFFALIFGWMFLEMGWTSMIGLVVIGMTDYTTVVGAFTSGFGNYLVATLFGCFMFAGILDQTGLTNFLAHWFLSRRFIKGRPYMLFLMILLGVEFIGTFANAFAACFILWALFLQMVQLAGYSKKESFVSYMICAILFIAMESGVIMPFHSGGVMYIGFFTNATGLPMNDLAFLVINALIVNLFIVILLVFLKFMLRPDLSKFTEAAEAFSLVKSEKMTRDQKFGAIALAVFVIGLLSPSFLPKTIPFVAFIGNLGVLGMSFVMIGVFSAMRASDGKSYVDIQKVHNSISWDVIWLIMATVPLAAAMESDATGIMATFMNAVTPTLSSMSPVVFSLVVFLFITLTTQIVHNLLLVILFIPIACPLAIEMGGDPYLVFFLIYWGSCLAFVTPAASMTAALMHGHPDVGAPAAYKNGLLYMVMGLIVCGGVILTLVPIFF